jgi:hypothetical protein
MSARGTGMILADGSGPRATQACAAEGVMESPFDLAERLMSQYEDTLPLKQICEEILTVLRDGGLRIGDPVPIDLASEAQHRLALASATGRPGEPGPGRGRWPRR